MPLVPLIDTQRRMAEVGRIRLGRKVAMSGGRTRPEKLAKFRLTSRDRNRLDHAAALYGGDVVEWEGEWELYTAADAIPIAVVPGQAITRHYEQWGQKTVRGEKTPVICLRRCDGQFEAKSDGPCICAGEEEMVCKPTTRLSVLLTEVPGLGVWRLESHGWNASTELAGTVELLEMLVASGRPIRARLRLDKRQSANEKGTRKFVVPVIDIDHTMGQVLDSVGSGLAPAVELEAGAPQRGGFTPVPELPAAPADSIAAQMAHVEQPSTTRPRRNAQQPIAPTGLAPRRADEISGAPTTPAPPENGERAGPAPVAAVSDPAPTDDDGPVMPLPQRVAMWCADAGLDDDGRHAFLAAFSGGRYASAKDVEPVDIATLRAKLVELKRGQVVVGAHSDGTPALLWAARDRGSNIGTGDSTTDVASDPQLEIWDESRWRAELAKVDGVGPAKLLGRARAIASDLGVTVPTGLDEITAPELVAGCLAWLNEKAAA